MEGCGTEDVNVFGGQFVLAGQHRAADHVLVVIYPERELHAVFYTPAGGEVCLAVQEVKQRSAHVAQVHTEGITVHVAGKVVLFNLLLVLLHVLKLLVWVFRVGRHVWGDGLVHVFEHVVADVALMEQRHILCHNHLAGVWSLGFQAFVKHALPVAILQVFVHPEFGLEVRVVKVEIINADEIYGCNGCHSGNPPFSTTLLLILFLAFKADGCEL